MWRVHHIKQVKSQKPLRSGSGEFFRFVLTAAHCIGFKGEKVFVVIGDHDKTDGGEAVTKRIKGRALPHKDYDSSTMDNDVAIIRYMHV